MWMDEELFELKARISLIENDAFISAVTALGTGIRRALSA
jgi:hypothetical protein